MTVARKIEEFMAQSSWIRKMFEEGIRLKKEYGDDKVYDFSLGNPNIHIEVPEHFKKILLETARDSGLRVHAYMPNAGFHETRTAIAEYLSDEHKAELTHDHVIMTCGAGGALNVALKTLLDPGDEVIIPVPFFAEYRFYIDNHGGVPRYVETHDDFSLDIEAIADAITDRTKIVLINSPNNPTGKVYDRRSIERLGELLTQKSNERDNHIYLIADEPYRDIVFDGIRVPSIFQAYDCSIIATSYSKTLSIPGERIGYLAVNPGIPGWESVINGMVVSTRILGFVNAPALMQRIVAKMQGVIVDIEYYRKKRDILCDGLATIGYEFIKPQGAFYLFPKSPIDDDVEFVSALQRRQILTVPGRGFGRAGYFRIAYCVDDRTILNSMKGFAEVMAEYR
ncbi:MAG: pyridoxal phosphate-dependent aminotransferase [Deltaproteobacteria bacterium]|nr:pyridoxal phosphate-dependent aminotransferase [Deltaproteobacteria bacterium]